MDNKSKDSKKLAVFTYNDKEYYITKPTVKVLRESKHQHSKAFTKALREGLPTKQQFHKSLIENDPDLFKEYADRKMEIIKYMTETEELLDKALTALEINHFSDLLEMYRDTITQEDLAVEQLYSHTAEAFAEDSRINFLIYSMLRDSEGRVVWDSIDLFEEEDDYEFIDHVKYQLTCWEYNLDPSWKENLPETKGRAKAEELRKLEEASASVDSKVTKEAAKKKPAAKRKSAAKKKTTTRANRKSKTTSTKQEDAPETQKVLETK